MQVYVAVIASSAKAMLYMLLLSLLLLASGDRYGILLLSNT
jgi:hypothetical protein